MRSSGTRTPNFLPASSQALWSFFRKRAVKKAHMALRCVLRVMHPCVAMQWPLQTLVAPRDTLATPAHDTRVVPC